MGCCNCKEQITERSSSMKDPTSGLGIVDNEETSTTSEGNDERRRQSKAWNWSLHKMAESVIDISSFETINYDAKEYEERSKLYSVRLDETRPINSKSRSIKNRKSFDPRMLMSKGKITLEDVFLIEDASSKSAEVARQAFKVKSDEQVVYPFQP